VSLAQGDDMVGTLATDRSDQPFGEAVLPKPSDVVELWTAHAKKQFETLTEKTKELSALGQKIAGESAEPITRGVNQAFKKAS